MSLYVYNIHSGLRGRIAGLKEFMSKGWELVGSRIDMDVPWCPYRHWSIPRMWSDTGIGGKPCVTATMQHGRISLPHSGTSVTAFQACEIWIRCASIRRHGSVSGYNMPRGTSETSCLRGLFGEKSSLRWHKGCATREWNQRFSWREVLGVVRVLITDPKWGVSFLLMLEMLLNCLSHRSSLSQMLRPWDARAIWGILAIQWCWDSPFRKPKKGP